MQFGHCFKQASLQQPLQYSLCLAVVVKLVDTLS